MSEREIKKHIISTYRISPLKISAVRGGVMNDNYKISSNQGDFIFRIYNRTPFETVHFEVEVLIHLASKNFKSPRITMALDGAGVVLFKEKPSVLYEYIVGKPVKKITHSLLEKIGGLMGRLHVSVSSFKPKILKESWEPVSFKKLLSLGGKVFRQRKVSGAKDLIKFLSVEMSQFNFPDLPHGVTHQDIKPENILVHKGEVSGLIDFDNSFYSAFIHDLTTTVIWTCFTNNKLDRSKLKALVRGYESERKLTPAEQKIFEDAIRWRLLREMFIGPFVTVKKTPEVKKRLEYFRKLYLLFS